MSKRNQTTTEGYSRELMVPEEIATYQDAQTGSRTFALPVRLPDGTHGVIMVCRMNPDPWDPFTQIKSVIVNFK